MKLLPTVRIIRVEEKDKGTFGALTICDHAFCVTLELPDRLNKRDISNIPQGQYICKKVISPKFGKTFRVVDVVDRTMVLFHKGNTIKDILGCIILAQHFGKLGKNRAVLNSGKTFKKFMKIMKNVNEFNLTIIECY